MKKAIRIIFILASLAMTIANWNNGFFPILASLLFLVGNTLTLLYSELRTTFFSSLK